MTLSNKPTVGDDIGTWGQELNDALDELDVSKADATAVYTKTQADGRYIRTINGVAPDDDGDVVVDVADATFSGIPNDGSVTDAKIATGGISPSKITGTAVTNSDTRLSNARTPTSHAASHGSGGADAITPSAIGAVANSAKGAANGVAPLGVDAKVGATYLPAMAVPASGSTFKIWRQPTEPTVGASDGDLWIKTP